MSFCFLVMMLPYSHGLQLLLTSMSTYGRALGLMVSPFITELVGSQVLSNLPASSTCVYPGLILHESASLLHALQKLAQNTMGAPDQLRCTLQRAHV